MGTATVTAIIVAAVAVIGLIFTLSTMAGKNYKAVRNAQVVADYKEGYDAIKAKSEGQEQQIGELQREGQKKDTKIAELEHDLDVLRGRMAVLQDYVTGKSAIEALTAQLAGLAETMNTRVSEVLVQVGDVRAAQREILVAVTTKGKT